MISLSLSQLDTSSSLALESKHHQIPESETRFEELYLKSDEIRIESLHKRILFLAKNRAKLLKNPDSNRKKIEHTNKELERDLNINKDLLLENPKLLQELQTLFFYTQDQVRFQEISKPFVRLGRKIGRRHARLFDSESIKLLYAELRRLLQHTRKKNPDLFNKYRRIDKKKTYSNSDDYHYFILPQALDKRNNNTADVIQHIDLENALCAVAGEEIRSAIHDCLKAEEAAHLIYRTTHGARSSMGLKVLISPNEIWEITKDLKPTQFMSLRCAYKELYGETLEQSMKDVFSGAKLQRAIHIIKGQKANLYADTLFHILKGWNSKTKRGNYIRELMSEIPIKDWKAVTEAFNKEYANRLGETNFYAALRNRIHKYDLDFIACLYRGDEAVMEAALARSILLGSKKHRKNIVTFLGSLEKTEIEALDQEIQEYHNISLLELINKQMPRSSYRDLAAALTLGHQTRINAAQVKSALDNSNIWTAAPFFGQTEKARNQLTEDYKEVYGKESSKVFWKDLKKAVRKKDFKLLARIPGISAILERTPGILKSYRFIKLVVENGKLEPEDILRYAIEGLGNDRKLIKSVLSAMTKREFNLAAKRYKEKISSRKIF